ncbi:MAG: TetR/AcrR family transcriptional regulator [Nocardioidaceae bacterium]|nr:TetR/AcrR family transcriptional regulator [Nocardioidaceae bacterium]
MPQSVKVRAYLSPRRQEQAAATRREILKAARDLFTRQGYAETTVAAVARRARVSVDTIYASVGRKPQLLLAVIDTVLGGGDDPLPAEQRDYVQEIRAAETAVAKIHVYAAALGRLLPATASLQEALRHAAQTDTDCAAVWRGLTERRAANMLLFASDLRKTNAIRDDLTDDYVADVVWSTNSVEYFLLLRQRGWTSEQYARWLEDLWCRTLLA